MATVAVTQGATRPPWQRFGPAAVTAALAVVLLAAWELVCRTVLDGSYTLSAPSAIVGQITDEWRLIQSNLLVTVRAAAIGFVIGNLVAMAMAFLAVEVRWLDRLVYRVALVVFCLPLVAVAPILRVTFGPGSIGPQVAMAALAVYFTTLVAATLGLRSASSTSLDVVHCLGGGRVAALHKVRVRAAIPALTAGLQVAAPAAFLGALVGEFTGAERGFGTLMIRALASLETDRVWAVAVVSTIVAAAAYVLLGWLAQRLSPWAADLAPSGMGSSGAGGVRRWLLGLGGVVVAVFAVLGLWVAYLEGVGLNPFFAKGPGDVWAYLVTEPEAAAQRQEVLSALWETLRVAGLGFAAGMVAATVLAMVFVAVPVVERVLLPVAIALRSVPIIATVPVLIIVAGHDLLGATLIVAVMSFFPTLVNVTLGLRGAPRQLIDVFQTYGAGLPTVFLKARLPAAMPALFASARVAVPASLLGATVAEWLATGNGMGNLMTVASGTANYDVLWACVVVLLIAALAAHSLVAAAERVVLSRFAPQQVRA